MVTMRYESGFHRALISVGVGAMVIAGEFVGEFLLRYAFHTGWREPQLALVSNSVGGLVGALLIYKLISLEAEREHLRKELNHRIRNALQPIAYCTPRLEEAERLLIDASVAQISACLRESLLTETSHTPSMAPTKGLPSPDDRKS